MDYTFPLGDSGLDAQLFAGGSYLSEIVERSLTSGVVTVDEADELFTARIAATIVSEKWTAGVFVDNLTDEDGTVGAAGFTEGFLAPRQRPRTAGIQLTYTY